MTFIYIIQISLTYRLINVNVQKIDSSVLKIYKMVIARFFLQNKLRRAWFFEKTFLLANTSMKMVLGRHFLSISKINIQFDDKSLIQKIYSAIKTLPITYWVKLINKKELARAVLNKNLETFVIHILILEAFGIVIYSLQFDQIPSTQLAML